MTLTIARAENRAPHRIEPAAKPAPPAPLAPPVAIADTRVERRSLTASSDARTIARHDPMAAAFRLRAENKLGTLARGDQGPEVARLQDGLVQLGHMTAEERATGPGTFGPRTQAALERFQAAAGLPVNGRYDAATRAAMEERLASPAATGLPTSAREANAHFVTQFTSGYNPTGPNSSANCGPASVAMALSAAGRMPAGLTPEQEVDYARALMNPGVAPSSYVTERRIPLLDTDGAYSSTGQIEAAFGAPSRTTQGWAALDAALAAGQPVVAHGHYAQSGWGATLAEAGRAQGYAGGYAGTGDVGHFNAILGQTRDGKYIVADPMYTGGTVELSRDQLAQFFAPHGGTPHFTALS